MTEAEEQMVENKENEKKQIERARAYKRLFQTDDGKIVLEDLEVYCGFYKPSVSEQSPNTLQTHFNEGKRRVYLRINGFLRRKENG